MFTITKVDIIPSQAGNGLKINDFEIGCAKIVEVELEEGKTLEETMFQDGLVPAIIPPTEDRDAFFNTKTLDSAKNYVLVVIEENSVRTITNARDVVRLFSLDPEDAEMLQKYTGALAADRNLVCHMTTDMNGEDVMFFTTAFDAELMHDYENGDTELINQKMNNMAASADFRTEYSTDSFIKMFLYALITACQDRFNKTNRENAIHEAARIISEIKFWNDGQLLSPSVADIEDYLANVKAAIRIN